MKKKRYAKAGAALWTAALVGLWAAPLPALAEHFEGDPDWSVSFTGSGMESNFKTADINDAIYNLQPGDSIDIALTLRNSDSSATDWWMTNKVLRSLEDTQESAASGGYTYTLVYQHPDGSRETLYSSETVGGENEDKTAAEGLHEATDALSEFFYLDTLYTGDQGYIYLTVALDGETQGNGYQDTLADLTLNFAVEELDDTVQPPDKEDPSGEEDTPDGGDPSDHTGDRRTPPKTGDDTGLMKYVAFSLLSGLTLLVLALVSLKKSAADKREQEKV